MVKFETPPPHPRIAAGMKASDHDDALRINPIQKSKGKPTNRHASNVPVEYLAGLRQLGDGPCRLGSGV